MSRHIDDALLSFLSAKPLGKQVRISTYELCRLLNGVTNRRFCHIHRTSEKRGNGNYGGAQNPTCHCSDNIIHCCRISWSETYQSLLKLERKGKVYSSRRRCLDIKRLPTFVQVSRDTYRMWELPPDC